MELFKESQGAPVHAECVTVMPKDIKLATRMLRGTGDFLAAYGISKREA